jgi:hypothetical protein
MKDTEFYGADKMTQTGHVAGRCFSYMAVCGGMERGDRPAKRKGIAVFAELLKTGLAALWVTDKIIAVIGEEKGLAGKALKVMEKING